MNAGMEQKSRPSISCKTEARILALKNSACMHALYGTVSAKIAPRLKCYKNASRLNRYSFPTDNAIDFLFSTLHTTPFYYEVLKLGSR